jgi:hypothetical protein
MKATPIAPVETQTIGFAPILKFFFEEAGVQTIIDQNVPLDPRRKILTHGQASVAMVTAILCQVFQMYRLCQFAEKSQILNFFRTDRISRIMPAVCRHPDPGRRRKFLRFSG